jgi:hypothetical protein
MLLLTACAPSLQEQVARNGQSVILVGVEINSDFTPGLVSGTPSDIYNLSLGLRGGRASAHSSRPRVVFENIDSRSRWLAFPVRPGVYQLATANEEAIENRLAVFASKKFTRFDDTGGTNAFEIGANEIVYIGSIRSQLGTNPGLLSRRLLRDARRSYVKDNARARWAVAQFGLSQGRFRTIDIFAGKPEALRQLNTPWSVRPIDEGGERERTDENQNEAEQDDVLRHLN